MKENIKFINNYNVLLLFTALSITACSGGDLRDEVESKLQYQQQQTRVEKKQTRKVKV